MLRQQGDPESAPLSENSEKNEEGLQHMALHLNLNQPDGEVKMRQFQIQLPNPYQ